jgi:hypothetical protein
MRWILPLLIVCLMGVVLMAAPLDDDLVLDPELTAPKVSDDEPKGSAVEIVRETITGEPSLPDPDPPNSTIAALQAFEAGNIDACLSHLKTSIAVRPTLPAPGVILAGFHLRDGNREEARRLLEEAATKGSRHRSLPKNCIRGVGVE